MSFSFRLLFNSNFKSCLFMVQPFKTDWFFEEQWKTEVNLFGSLNSILIKANFKKTTKDLSMFQILNGKKYRKLMQFGPTLMVIVGTWVIVRYKFLNSCETWRVNQAFFTLASANHLRIDSLLPYLAYLPLRLFSWWS